MINFNKTSMLKSFQLRVARSVTGIEVREVALYLGISRTIISRWENKPILDYIKTKKVSLESLFFFFKQHGIMFPDEHSVRFVSQLKPYNSIHLTRFQLRASRAALGLTQDELADLTNTSRSIINYLEIQNNETLLNTINKDIDDLVFKKFFQIKGLLFPDSFTICYTNTETK
ncbi:MAG: XRE family transcriptional regulator [Alphaproteobacteria bacterium]|jgi:transcriptional regulator with XRE-family HTH domain|nr:XRE family transcriptional regulator [Alphaproteobacteria bacterium]